MASSISNKVSPPYQNKIVDTGGLVTTAWQSFFRLVKNLLDPIGYEINFDLANNQVTTADVTGLTVNKAQVSQAIVEYLIQRVTTGTGATQLIETGIFFLSYSPTKDEWRISLSAGGSPDDSGINFMVTPQFFTATYDHTLHLWLASGLALINGAPVTLFSTGSLPTGYLTSTTYYVINASAGASCQLSLTPGGSVVTATTNNGSGTISMIPTHAADGQVQYNSTNITGTASISKIVFRMRTFGGKNQLYSQSGSR